MQARKHHRRALAIRASFVLASTILVLALFTVVEVGLRLTGIPEDRAEPGVPSWVDGETLALLREWTGNAGVQLSDLEDLPGWRWDPELRWSLRPDLRMSVRNIFLDPSLGPQARWRFTTNARGFRTPEFRQAKEQGTTRVVVIGDSNSMGWLLNDDEAYPRRLESYLTRSLGRPVEVINLAIPGYTSFACRRILERVALGLEPDALVLSFGANDNQEMATSDARYAQAGSGPAAPIRLRLAQLRLTRVLRRILPRSERDLVARVTPDEFGANVAAMLAETSEREIPTVFLRLCCCRPDYLAILTEATERFRTPVLDANEALEAFSDPDVRRRHAGPFNRVSGWYPTDAIKEDLSLLFLFRDRCHLTPLGADLVAAALADELAERLAPSSERRIGPGPAEH